MFYVIDDNKNLVEALDKQGVLSVLEQAIEDGSLENIMADSAFVSKIKCCVSGVTNQVAFVTQAKYNELQASGQIIPNAIYFITDDTTADDLSDQLEALTTKVNSLETSLSNEIAKRDSDIDWLYGIVSDNKTELDNDIKDTKIRHSSIGVSSITKDILSKTLLIRYDGELVDGSITYQYYGPVNWEILNDEIKLYVVVKPGSVSLYPTIVYLSSTDLVDIVYVNKLPLTPITLSE